MLRRGIRFLPCEVLPPEKNMDIDRHLLLSMEEGSSPPVLRLYRWDRLSVSIGAYQKKVPELSVPVVRRPTGGGALLHGWDLSFSYTDGRSIWGRTPRRIYKRVAGLFIQVFSSFGVKLNMSTFDRSYSESWLCFTYPTFGELTLDRRKAVAMAMKTMKRSFLIHGSIYITFDPGVASSLLGVEEEIFRERVLQLKDLGISPKEIQERITQAFLRKREELLLTLE